MEYLISVPLKKGSDIDLVKPLKNLIASLYSTADAPADHSSSINEFNKLRSTAVSKQYEKSQPALEALFKYYDQIAAIEYKIPPQEVQIPFKWKDAFDKGGIFGGKVSLTVSSLGYEKVCILFNIAAMQSQLGSACKASDSDEELKNAAKMFQSASGIFASLRSGASVMGGQEPTPDLSSSTLTVLSTLMLAQAQELFVHKAIQDKMKDGIISKLAMQAEDLYAETLSTMQKETKVYWEKDWLSTIAGKQAAFVGLANYFQSSVCGSKKQVGEQIARLNLCLEQFKTAQTRSNLPNLFSDYVGKATRALTDAKKDNDFIYHERIPDSLSPIEKTASARLAKPTPVPDKFTHFKDLFDDLTPVQVHQAMASCDVRKTEMMNIRINQLREGSNLLNSILASLNLPAALEDQGSGSSVPASLVDKSRLMQSGGGFNGLNNAVADLPSLGLRNKEILDVTEKMIKEEEESDATLRAQLKEKWTRMSSDKLNATFKGNLEKYRTIVTKAMEADETIREKLSRHREGMEVLSGGENAIASKLPSNTSVPKGPGAANAKEQLKHLMKEVDKIKAERDEIELKIRNLTFDLKTPFLRALTEDGAINEPALSTELLGHAFVSLDPLIKGSLDRQESILGSIQQTADEYFGRTMGGNVPDANSREAIMRQLAESYDSFNELQSMVKEGTKFYNDLTQILIAYQNKVSDYCFARKTEKEELLKDVTRDAAAHSAAPPPSSSAPPPRPPPPSFPSTPYSSSTLPPQGSSVAAVPPPSYYSPPAFPPYPTHFQPTGMPLPYGTQGVGAYPYPPQQGYNPYPTYPLPQHHPQHAQQNYPYPVQQGGVQYQPTPYGQQPPPQ